MIETLLRHRWFRQYFPLLAGIFFTVLFISLGRWQLDRAAEKKVLLDAFEGGAGYTEPTDFERLAEYDRIRVSGRYLPDRQILIDNIPLDGRLGYYAITPFELPGEDALLLVNRGWTPKSDRLDKDIANLSVDDGFRVVKGLVGHLPRVAIRPGEAFAVHGDWPRLAIYPELEEVGEELDETLLPVVLLLSAGEDDGFVRRWQPDTSGPATHYGYAFQWFAMAAAVVLIVGWHVRKRIQE